ncbi:MAG: DUF84 family protein [Anaerolineae bacterium]
MRAAVGSTNPVKIAAAEAVIRRLYGTGIEIVPIDVASGVAAQPWGDVETRRGAINRARAALETTKAELGLGLEGGVLEIEDGGGTRTLYTTAWCAVIDRTGTLGVGGGAHVALPPTVAAAVRDGAELGSAIDDLVGETDTRRGQGAIGVLTQGWLDRQTSFEHVLTLAFARLLSAGFYTNGDTGEA